MATIFSVFVAAYILVIPAYFVLRLLAGLRLPAGQQLRLHYLALGLLTVLSLAQPLLPHPSVYQPTVKFWSGASMRTMTKEKSDLMNIGYGKKSAQIETRKLTPVWWFLAMATLGFSLARMAQDLLGLLAIAKKSFCIRRIGHLAILVSDHVLVPFSYRDLFRSYVVIPAHMVSHRRDFKIAVAHEIQHHRQGDTAWIYWIWFLKAVFVLQPVFYFWHRWLLEIQEFACDETLLDHGKVSSGDYARCLVETAETAFYQQRPPACATGLMFLVERHLISRRIEKMFNQRRNKLSRGMSLGLMIALGLALTSAAYATSGVVQDRRVSKKEAFAMLKAAQAQSDFPLVVNDLVLNELNRYIGTEDGRAFMRNALARMESYRDVVGRKLNQYGLPPELVAIPITESGYANRLEDGVHGHGAGLWMFIKSTARNYGLNVDGNNDDRLNPSLETDAAMRYLESNNLRFNDWLLAIFAYNVGEQSVQAAMDKLKTRDVWTLIRQGYENDQHYLARVMAAILIMKNPDSVK